jgi:hypothetical protein
MKKKTTYKLVILFTISLVPLTTTATVTINLGVGELYDVSDNKLTSGVGLLVADVDGTGFIGDYLSNSSNFDTNAFNNTTLTPGNSVGASTNRILSVFNINQSQAHSATGEVSITLDSSLTTGDMLGFYWFPTIRFGTGTISGSVSQYGFYRSDSDSFLNNSTTTWFMPAESASVELLALTPAFSGSLEPAALTAIPEPSTYVALFGVLALGAVVMRRRNRR